MDERFQMPDPSLELIAKALADCVKTLPPRRPCSPEIHSTYERIIQFIETHDFLRKAA